MAALRAEQRRWNVILARPLFASSRVGSSDSSSHSTHDRCDLRRRGRAGHPPVRVAQAFKPASGAKHAARRRGFMLVCLPLLLVALAAGGRSAIHTPPAERRKGWFARDVED